MTLTKRQKTLMVVFFIGLAALGVDRTFLRPQGGAAAASADPLLRPDERVSPLANVPVLQEPPGRTGVAARLDRLWSDKDADPEQGRDPFAPAAPWGQSAPSTDTKTVDEAALFIAGHRLTAVVIDPRASYAVVNDRALTPGQSIDGFKLVSIGKRSALFEQGGRRAVLELVNQ
jgi:hypothetical protein